MEADPETEEEVNSRTVPAGASELEMELHETPNVLRDATANEVDDGERDLNEILLLMNVCPDEIGEDSDEAYESDFEEIDY